MERFEYRFNSAINAESALMARMMLYVMMVIVAIDTALFLVGEYIGFSFLLIPLAAIHLVAKSYTREVSVNRQRVRYENRIFAKTFSSEELLRGYRFMYLDMVPRKGNDTISHLHLHIYFVPHDVKGAAGISLRNDMNYRYDADPDEVAHVIHQLHLATGYKMRFEETTKRYFYNAYVEKYGLDNILNPTLSA